VSKKSRKDRHKAQMHRAATSGDLSSLRAATQRAPATAAAVLTKALQAHGAADPPEELCAMVASTCERLRADGSFDQALRLAAAARRATHAVRLEEALAAFGCGADDTVLQLAESDPLLAKAIAPLIAVLRRGPVPQSPAGSTELTRGVHALCRAARSLDSGKPGPARTSLQAIAGSCSSKLRLKDWSAAVSLATGRVNAMAPARELLSSPLVRSSAAIERSLACALAVASPQAFLDRSVAKLGLSKDALARGTVLALRSSGELRGDEAPVMSLVMTAGADAFPAEHRGAAALYEGFAFVATDAARAQAAFDKAVAHGGDMGEALRGRLLASRVQRAQYDVLDRSALKNAISATQRLLHLLSQRRDGAPFRALLFAELAGLFGDSDQSAYALDAIRQCRALLDAGIDAPALSARLVGVEVLALQNDPKRALEVVEQGLQKHPRVEPLMAARVELLDRLGRKTEADDAVLEAAELFKDPDLMARAKGIRRGRGLAVLQPGKTTAGELAAELAQRADAAVEAGTRVDALAMVNAADLTAARAQLEPAARVAYDAAAVAIMATNFPAPEAARVAAHLLRDPSLSRDDQRLVIAAPLASMEPEELPLFARALAVAGLSAELLADAGRMVAIDCEREPAMDFLAQIAAQLSSKAVREIQTLCRKSTVHDPRNPQLLVRKISKLLEPGFDLMEYASPDEDFDPGVFDPEQPDGMFGPEEGRLALRMCGAPEAKIARIPDGALERIAAALHDLAFGSEGDQKFREVELAMQAAGLEPRDVPRLFGASKPGAGPRSKR